ARAPAPVVGEADGRVVVRAGALELRFDRAASALDVVRCGGRDRVLEGPRLQLWRAATDNDGIRAWNGAGKPLARWLAWGLDRLALEPGPFAVREGRDRVTVTCVQHGVTRAGRVRHEQVLTVHGDGSLRSDHTIDVPEALDDLPRVGVRLRLAGDLEELAWFGRGPHETHRDRRQAVVGVHRGRLEAQWVPYVLPQENGNKTEVRWLALDGPAGGLRVDAGRPIEFSVHRFTAEEIYAARHQTDLVPRDHWVLNLDARQCGVGSASVGPETPARHRVGPGRHRLRFDLRPTP
ncbi:MAG: beta-galactosidase small subunit, partial [Myxococcota bacterium]